MTFFYCVAIAINPVLTLCCDVTVGVKVVPKFRCDLYPFGSSRDLACVACVSGVQRRRGATCGSRVNLFHRDPDARSNIM